MSSDLHAFRPFIKVHRRSISSDTNCIQFCQGHTALFTIHIHDRHHLGHSARGKSSGPAWTLPSNTSSPAALSRWLGPSLQYILAAKADVLQRTLNRRFRLLDRLSPLISWVLKEFMVIHKNLPQGITSRCVGIYLPNEVHHIASWIRRWNIKRCGSFFLDRIMQNTLIRAKEVEPGILVRNIASWVRGWNVERCWPSFLRRIIRVNILIRVS